MILILGAAHAGKHETARQLYHISEFCDGQTAAFSDILQARAVSHFHLLVRRILAQGESPQDFTRRFLRENPDAVVLTNEIGCGIVPIEREERLWREECGICTRLLAAQADCVIRVVCGISTAIKGELP